MSTFWRLAREPFQELDGEGARLYGGRWNSVGTPVVYASGTLSLAVLEMLVHVDPEDLPRDLVALRVEVAGKVSSHRVRPEELPDDWAEVPGHPACRELGDEWLANGKSLLLRVPSAIVWEEENVLVNPRHPEAEKLQVASVRPFRFDARLLRSG
ncbi:MAG: RES domain-containing protein [Gemmatimonadales bacterium]|nr:MAG: RES domain-containing protein [Gemmatimonadales bacterium]